MKFFRRGSKDFAKFLRGAPFNRFSFGKISCCHLRYGLQYTLVNNSLQNILLSSLLLSEFKQKYKVSDDKYLNYSF